GCGQCGGTGCGSIDMGYITPYLDHEPASNATSTSYCCTSSFTVNSPTCGDGVSPPCLIAAEDQVTETVTATLAPEVASSLIDNCGLPDIPGVMDTSGTRCCPQGCGMCGGVGCGLVDMNLVAPTVEGDVPIDAKSGDYCCTSGVDIRDVTCGTGTGDDEGYPPCFIPAGTGTVTATLAPEVSSNLIDNCGLPGIPGIMDATGTRCCPQGCGMCGGSGCGSVDMNLVAPTVEGDVPIDAKSGDYCCTSGVDTRDVTCGTGTGDDEGYPPCFIPADFAEDTCYVEGVEGVSDDGVYCCPLGCGQCGGEGCGAIPVVNIFPDGRELPEDATASSYCCLKAFVEIEVVCGDPGVEPPCMIPEVGTSRPPVAAPVDTGDGSGSGSGGGNDTDITDGPDGVVGGGSTPSPSAMETMDCKTISVIVDELLQFDGIYHMMAGMNETLFLKNDSSAIMSHVPYEGAATNTTSTTTTALNATSECGYWILAEATGNYSLTVQDCATNPDDIDTAMWWMVEGTTEATPEHAVEVMVECVDMPSTPSTPSPASTGGSGGSLPDGEEGDGVGVTDGDGEGGGNGDGGDGSPTPAPADDSTGGAQDRSVDPGDAANTEDDAPSSSSKGGLSTGEAVGVGVACSVVAVVGAVGLTRWAKGGG
ncbi:unnamed protein product, partial [Ectocarpus sp. 6 AP-2014]